MLRFIRFFGAILLSAILFVAPVNSAEKDGHDITWLYLRLYWNDYANSVGMTQDWWYCRGSGCPIQLDNYYYPSPDLTTTPVNRLPSVPVRTGYRFNGFRDIRNVDWVNSSGNFQRNLDNENVSAVEYWTPNKYTVTLDNQGATSSGTAGPLYEVYETGWYTNSTHTNSITTITKPSKNKDTFGGYYTSANCAGTMVINSAGNIVGYTTSTRLYACWISKNGTWGKITINPNGATGGTTGTKYIYEYQGYDFYRTQATTYPITNSLFATTGNGGMGMTKPTKSDAVFAGYYTGSSTNGVKVVDENGYIIVNPSYFTGATTIYAGWHPNTTITLSPNGGTGCLQTVTTGVFGGAIPTISCAPPPPSGKEFAGYVPRDNSLGASGCFIIYDADLNPLYPLETWQCASDTYSLEAVYVVSTSNVEYFCDATETSSARVIDTATFGESYTARTYDSLARCIMPSGWDSVHHWSVRSLLGNTPVEVGTMSSGVPVEWDIIEDVKMVPVFSKYCAEGTYWRASDNSCQTCRAGYYCSGVTIYSDVSYNSDQGKNACPSPYSSSASGNPTLNDCYLITTAGNYVASAGAGESTCPSGYYCPGGTTIYKEGRPSPEHLTYGGNTVCAAGKYSASGASSCSNVTAGYFTTGGGMSATPNTTVGGTSGNDKNGCLTGYTCGKVSAGYYGATGASVNTGSGACGAGTYSTGGATSCSNVTAGYYNTGCGTSATGGVCSSSYSGGQISDGYYCSAGAKKAAPASASDSVSSSASCGACSGLTAPSVTGGTFSSASVRNAATACRYVAPDKTTPVNCSGISKNTVSYTSSGWGTNFYTVTSAAGYYITANNNANPTCAVCGAGTYTDGNNQTSCSNVDAGYFTTGGGMSATPNNTVGGASGNGSNGCLTGYTCGKVSAGCYGAAGAGTSCPSSCTSGTYSTGGASSCSQCSALGYPSGFTSGTFSTSPTSAAAASSACRFTAPTPSTTPTNCSSISSNTVSYTGSAWNTPTFHVTSAAGKYIVSNDVASPSCAACATGSYNNAANQTSCSVCGSGTTTSGAGQTSCNANCSNNNAYDHAWATPSWNNNSPTGLCKITSCKAGSYYTSTNSGNTNTCTACADGSYKTGDGHTTTACSLCSDLSGVSPSGGSYSTGGNTGSTANTACKYTAPNKTITGCKTVTSQTVTYSGSAWPASTYGVTASAGYVIANNNTSSATCSACGNGTYQATDGSTATSCTACSTTPGYPSGFTSGTFSTSPTSAAAASSACRFTAPTPSTTPTNCSSISSNTVSYTGSAWNTPTFHVTSAAGRYIATQDVASPTCGVCAAGKYTDGNNKTSCSNVTAGYFTTGGGMSATPNNTVGGTSGNGSNGCLTGYTCGKVSAGCYGGAGAGTSCPSSCTSGTYSAGGASSCSQCSALGYPSGYSSSNGSFSSVSPFNANTTCRFTGTKSTPDNCSGITGNAVSYTGSAWNTPTFHVTSAAGRYIATQDVASPTCGVCAAGKYTSSANQTSCSNVNAGYFTTGGGMSATPNNTVGGASGNGSNGCLTGYTCGKVSAGCYGGAGAGTSCPSSCTSGTYSTGGESSCTACPSLTSGYAYVSGTGWTAVTQCQEQMRPTNCYSGYLTKTSNSSGAWQTAESTLTAKAGYKTSGSGDSATCSACGSGYYSSNGNDSTCDACPTRTDSTWTVATTSTTATTYSACYETKPASSVSSYCHNGQLKKTAATASTWNTAVSTLTAKQGSILTGSGDSTSCAQCTGATYMASADGHSNTSCSSCPDAESTWTQGTGTGWKAVTSCYETKNATSISSYCSAGVAKKFATNSTTWGTASASTAFQAKAGSIVNGLTCEQCENWSYSAGGTATQCSACKAVESGWTKRSGTGWSTYADCKETKTGSAISSYCDGGVLTKTQTDASTWGSSEITTTLTAVAGSIVSGQTCTQCSGSVYSAGGTATQCTACPAQTSGWTRATGNGWTGYSNCTESKTISSCYTGYKTLTKTADSSSTWGTATGTLKAPKGYYVTGSGDSKTCSQCSGATYQATDGSTATSCTACPAQTSGWTRATGNGWTAATSCYETQTPANCEAGSVKHIAKSDGSAWESTVSLVTALTANNGYYASSTATSCTACPTTPSGYSLVSGTGWTSYSNCQVTKAYSSVSSYCHSGALTKTASSASAYGTAVSTLTAKQGSILTGSGDSTSCAQCTGATYMASADGHSNTSCSSCPAAETNWTQGTGTGWSVITSCFETRNATAISTYCDSGVLKKMAKSDGSWDTASAITAFKAKAGSYITGSGNSLSCSQCPIGSYTTAVGTQTSCTVCGSADATKGKTTSAKGKTSCDANCSNNNKVATWTTASWTSGAPANVCKVATCGAGASYSSSSNGSCTNCADGSYMASTSHTNTSCSLCSALTGVNPSGGTYSTGGNTGSTASTACQYLAPNKTITGCYSVTSQAVTYSGSAWPASTYGVTASAGYVIANNNTSSATCTICSAGTYQGTDGSTNSCQVCDANTYSNAGASSCTACATANGYGNSGNSASAHSGIASCKATCGPGTYVATAGNACANVGTTYWGAGGVVAQNATLARTACPSGMVTYGSGYGANEAGDCGRILHAGDYSIYLRSVKKTTPSLNVKIGDTTYYGNMHVLSSGKGGHLHMNYDGNTYLVCDETGNVCSGI